LDRSDIILQVRDNGKEFWDILSRLFIPFCATKVTAGAGLGYAAPPVTPTGGDISVETLRARVSQSRSRAKKLPKPFYCPLPPRDNLKIS
jgi:hypothetical protein